MAVTFLSGFEAQADNANGFGYNGTVSTNTTQFRSGAASIRCNPASGASGYITPFDGLAVGQFLHFGLYVAALPTLDRVIAGMSVSAGNLTVRLRSDGKLSVFEGTTLVGTSTTALSTATWYWIGYRELTGTSVVFLQINGVNEVTGTATVSTGAAGSLGCRLTEASAIDISIDDFIVDGAGFLPPSKVDMALPISDNGTHTGWVGGGGGTTNLWDAVNNTPPLGAVTDTDLINIQSQASVGGSYVANLETYTTLGIVPGDTILACQSLIRHGEDIATGTKNGTLGAVTNPTISDSLPFTFGNDAGAHGAEVGLWKHKFGSIATSPSVTLGTSPTLTITRPNELRVGCVDWMGLQVAWTPAAVTTSAGSIPKSPPFTLGFRARPGAGIFHPLSPPQGTTTAVSGPITLAFIDSLTSSDTLGRALTLGRDLADALTTSSTVTRLLTLGRALADAVTTSDALGRTQTLARAFADAVTTSDVLSRVLTLGRALADSVTTSDTLARVLTLGRAFADAVTTSDALAFVKTKAMGFADTVTTSDALVRVLTLGRSFADTVTSSDALARVVTLGRSFADTVTTATTLVLQVSGQKVLAFADAVTTSDALARVLTLPRALADAVTTSSTLVLARTFFRTFTDAVTTSSTLARVLTLGRSLADAVTTSDVLNRATTILRTFADAVATSSILTFVGGPLQTIGGLGPQIVGVVGSVVRAIANRLGPPDGGASGPTPGGSASGPTPGR